jgi:hypothetical protein
MMQRLLVAPRQGTGKLTILGRVRRGRRRHVDPRKEGEGLHTGSTPFAC